MTSPPPATRCKSHSILVVQDEAEIRLSLQEALEWEGYQVFAASNGREALERLPDMPNPCVILLDLMMPVMNGWELAAALIETLLDMSRIRLGQFALRKAPDVDLSEVTQAVVARHRPHWEAAGTPVTVRVDGTPPHGLWDRVRLEQVIGNLVSNAIKYGGGRPIEIAISHDKNVATLSVQDHGIGISAEDQARIFNRFERAGSIKSFGGLGLGLYITRQIVSSHGGTIRVESELGAGSTFIVELPFQVL